MNDCVLSDGLFGIIVGFVMGVFAAMLGMSIYCGFLPEDKEEYEDVY